MNIKYSLKSLNPLRYHKILMRYIGIPQFYMEHNEPAKPDFETSVTFEPHGIFWCGFRCCAQENELYHFIYVSLSTVESF